MAPSLSLTLTVRVLVVEVSCLGHVIGEGFDKLIWAIGREPNVDELDLEKAGVEVTTSGHIKVYF